MFSLLHVRMALCVVSADTIDVLRTVFFCVFLKLEEISPRFKYFLEYTVGFYIFVKLEEISPTFRYFLEYTVRFYLFVKLVEISPTGLINGK